jgi:hypothetical protein
MPPVLVTWRPGAWVWILTHAASDLNLEVCRSLACDCPVCEVIGVEARSLDNGGQTASSGGRKAAR